MERNTSIDILRFIGISVIIFPHILPPEYLFHATAFNVPLMVFVSGLAYSGRDVKCSWNFVKKRFMRLLVPTYIFLSLYFFLALFICKGCLHIDFGITREHVVGSYLLMEGIGFVWIIRVLLMVSLLTPTLVCVNKSLKLNCLRGGVIICTTIMLDIILDNNLGTENVLLREFVYYAVGYSIIFLAGLRACSLSGKHILVSVLALFIMLIVYPSPTISGDYKWVWWHINDLKYPPRAIYIFYGLLMSMTLWGVVRKMCAGKQMPRLLKFIGGNTIWIYLWHIPVLQISSLLHLNWALRYIVVYAGAVAIFSVQFWCMNKFQVKYAIPYLKYLKG